MNFGPAEMAEMMEGARALFIVATVSSVGIGIVLGAIIGLYRILFRHRATDQSPQSAMPTVPPLPTVAGVPTLTALLTVPALQVDSTATTHSLRSAAPRASSLLRLVCLLGIIVLVGIAEGLFLYYASKRPDFEPSSNPPVIRPQQQGREATSNQPLPPAKEPQQPQQPGSEFEETYKQLGIQALPLTVERQQQIQSRLAQLRREACYTDAMVGLGRALLVSDIPARRLLARVAL
jgi:hypothetical protein